MMEPLEPRVLLSAIDFSASAATLYAAPTQDGGGGAIVIDSGAGIELAGNTWRKIQIDYTITPDTVLEFDFQSNRQGDIHAIGFDNDETISPETTFALFGTQGDFGLHDFDDYAGPGEKHYRINVGDYFTGTMPYLVLVNDHDVPTADAQSLFRNVELYEATPPPPPPGDLPPPDPGALDTLDLSTFTIQSYSAQQDVAGSAQVEDGGATLHLNGNTWKRVAINTAITAHTVIEFDFRSTAIGDIHGIGFDNDDVISPESSFALFGTQSDFGRTDHRNYDGSGQWTHYRIEVGAHFTGSFASLVLINDHDVASPSAESYIANIAIYDDVPAPPPPDPGELPPPNPGDLPVIDLSTFIVQSYAGTQDVSGAATVEDGGATLQLSGNVWKKITLPSVVTANTVLEFDFRSTAEGDIHAIGFDNDNALSPDTAFALFGTQQDYGIIDFHDYDGLGQWMHVRIELGAYFTGSFSSLVFINDHDVPSPDGDSYFANIAIYDDVPGPPTPGDVPPPAGNPGDLDFDALTIDSYAGIQDEGGAVMIENDGATLHVEGNLWKKTRVDYAITANTVLEFDFRSTTQGDIHAIGFDNDDAISYDQTFALYGSQKDFGLKAFRTYFGDEGEWKHYRIPVGQLYTGTFAYLTFVNDHDAALANADSFFANVTIYEGDPDEPPPPIFDEQIGYGLLDIGKSVALAAGVDDFTEQPTFGGSNDWHLNLVRAPEVWAAGYTGEGTLVAVIDTGVDYTHPQLAANIYINPGEIADNGIDDDANGFIDDVRGWDFVAGDNDPMDENYHGTAVAGVIAAANDGVGTTGVAYAATILPVRVLNSSGTGTYVDMIAGINYAAAMGADVINISIAASTPSQAVFDALASAEASGAVVVMAAGNNGDPEPVYPGRYAQSVGMAIGAVRQGSLFWGGSNRAGPSPLSYIAAPGVSVRTTHLNHSYAFATGTSFAAPHVSGAIALMLEADDTLTPVQLIDLLILGANPFGIVT
jgi:hypothetical protein